MNRAPTQAAIDTMPKPITRYTNPISVRFTAPVTRALRHWKPKTSGSSIGSTTNAASSLVPMRLGIEAKGRPCKTLNTRRTRRRARSLRGTRGRSRGGIVEVQGVQDLEEVHEAEQREPAREDVLGGGVVRDQVRQARPPERSARALESSARGRPRPATNDDLGARTARPKGRSRYSGHGSVVRERARALRPPRRRRVHVRRHGRALGPGGLRGRTTSCAPTGLPARTSRG